MIRWNVAWIFSVVIFKILFRLSLKGANSMSHKGPAIIVANHKSYADPILVGLTTHSPIHFMAKEELFRIPILKSVIKAFYAFPVKRGGSDRQAMLRALDLLKKGQRVGIFPEGKRVRTKELGEAEQGVAFLAFTADVPIVPIAIDNNEQIMPEGTKFLRLPKLTVIVGVPFRLPHTGDRKFDLQQGAKLIMTKINELLEREGSHHE